MDPQLKRLLKKLNTDEFGPYRAFLKRELDNAYDTLAKSTEPATLYRMQGRIAVIESLLGTIARFAN